MNLIEKKPIELPVIKPNSNGIVFYRGKSEIDGAAIVAIATLKTSNAKTGDMVQTWILREDMDPMRALSEGADESVCGDCKHRGDGHGRQRSCYVNIYQAPLNIYRTYKAGKYTNYDSINGNPIWLKDRLLRCGSYGDPAAVPFEVFEHLTKNSIGWTGYSHQWKKCDQRYSNILMASVDSEEERVEAKEKGWRTFRVRSANEPTSREVICPASEESGKRKTCEECLACAGTRHGKLNSKAADVVIVAHGNPVRLRAWSKNKPIYVTKDSCSESGQLVGDRGGHQSPQTPARETSLHPQEDVEPARS